MTLFELIAVLGLLSVIAALVAPSLSTFFRGRGFDEDARRIVAYTRFAQSEAVSRGVPMDVWFDESSRKCGVRPQSGYDPDHGIRTAESQLSDNVTFVFPDDITKKITVTDVDSDMGKEEIDPLTVIRYQPDGTRDTTSLAFIGLRDRKGSEVRIQPVEDGPLYTIAIRKRAS
jgi:Tfp pilus assembly protein FimT